MKEFTDVWVKTVMGEVRLPRRTRWWEKVWHCWIRGHHRWVSDYDEIGALRRACLRCGRRELGMLWRIR